FFQIDRNGLVTVLHLTKPRLSEEDNIEQLGQELSVLVDQFGCLKLVVDFEIVTFITSAVLGKFIALHRNLHRKEGQLAMCNMKGMVKDVLSATKLDEYFLRADSVELAISSFMAENVDDSEKTAG
ncbi:MAG: STAS domain-containing protein, partial [Planctomycetes bacterium]|nr:STAS domain-containing protein [Planctomycetota bacterium]